MIYFVDKLVVLLLLVLFSHAKTGEVCFPFASPEASIEPPQQSQGRPGKIGPRGPQGMPGEVGEPGPPGRCSCNPSEIQQLREEIRIRDGETIFVLFFITVRIKKCKLP